MSLLTLPVMLFSLSCKWAFACGLTQLLKVKKLKADLKLLLIIIFLKENVADLGTNTYRSNNSKVFNDFKLFFQCNFSMLHLIFLLSQTLLDCIKITALKKLITSAQNAMEKSLNKIKNNGQKTLLPGYY